MLADLHEGEVRVLCNVDVASEGFDEPRVECALPPMDRWTDAWRGRQREGGREGEEGREGRG
jgi:hypothetical protein